ncbi:MAG: DUF1800 domain-containing protein [Nocardiaceae bacterium]|nr:DUF1800 domain-containing protein [Nocardiaceae bacterium]
MSYSSDEWIRTARVLRRAGFGATGPEIDAVTAVGADAYIAYVLATDPSADPAAKATPIPVFQQPRAPSSSATAAEYSSFFGIISAQLASASNWWVRRMATAQLPLHEKVTWIWHDHFATSSAKVLNAAMMVAQNETFRLLGRGDFKNLVYAMVADPAMLYWLDGVSNVVQAPNENLAREILELFCLGHNNGYTEHDIKDGARALTGWQVGADGRTHVVPALHDASVKTVLGKTGNINAQQFCDAILAKHESARFIATKLWHYFASDSPPSDAVLNRIIGAYGPGRNLSAAMRMILADDEFFAASGTSVVTPIEWLIGIVRALRIPVSDDAGVGEVAGALSLLRQVPFQPPNVGGWPRGRSWLTTSVLPIRAAIAESLVRVGDISIVESAQRTGRTEAVGYLLGIGHWTDASLRVLKGSLNDPRELVVVALNSPEYLTS